MGSPIAQRLRKTVSPYDARMYGLRVPHSAAMRLRQKEMPGRGVSMKGEKAHCASKRQCAPPPSTHGCRLSTLGGLRSSLVGSPLSTMACEEHSMEESDGESGFSGVSDN